MTTLTLELTNNEVFSILQVLGKQPYEQTAGLITKIESQRSASNEEVLSEEIDYEELFMKPV